MSCANWLVRWRAALIGLAFTLLGGQRTAVGQEPVRTTPRGDSLVIRLLDVELRTAVQALVPYLDRPAIVGGIPALRVSIETPMPIARVNVVRFLREMLDANGSELTLDSAGTLYRIRAKEPPRPPMPEMNRPAAMQAAPELFVIRLQHAKASEVAATVNALYGKASALGEIGERPSTLAQQLQQQQVPPGIPPNPQMVPNVAGRVASLAGETTIVPDARANSLLIRASRADFELIQAAVTQLDVRPLQVLIEVLIAEYVRGRGFDLGVDGILPKTTIDGTENTTISGILTGPGPEVGLGGLAVRIMNISGADFDATIRAAASVGKVRIINRPVLLAANNEAAEINVGSQRPFVQVARVLPTDNTARDQVVQYRDVGTRLSIVPTISVAGYVMLQVVQEINAATEEQQFNAPIISTRSVETRLLVKDGQTIVLGGLSERLRENVSGGIPFLSEIPYLGGFFGRQKRRTSETELLLFLTPRIIRDDKDVDAITQPLRKRADAIKP